MSGGVTEVHASAVEIYQPYFVGAADDVVGMFGAPIQVIGINGQFPGPIFNITTNWNVVVNVKNDLDEPLLLTWKNSWQDGVSGTNCPIPASGYGGIIINNRDVIPLLFGMPDGDITIFISDWYTKSHKGLRKDVEKGVDLGVPDGILINGLGPNRCDQAFVKDGIVYHIINVEPGKTYRFRVHNVGISTSLIFRIQSHNLLLVETEGSYTVQKNYSNMDIHVGQSFSSLVTKDRTSGPASGPLPDPPNDYDTYFSMNQARSIRWNVSAGAARPNPQGSFKYGEITVTDVYVILNRLAELIDGKHRTTLNGISDLRPSTPLKLAQQFKIPGGELSAFDIHYPWMPGYMDLTIFRLFSSMDFGVWTENSRSTYNKWDGVARSTTQVFPGAWTAILVSLDNAGIWNLRAQNLDSWYLGQEAYISVVNPEVDQSEALLPENSIYCGILSSLQKDQAQRVNFSARHRFLIPVKQYSLC
ncbi:hypothetical protein F3Y22_tig00111398pilonHSYRG00328 [Hibiscus syriacus]|uniref:Monocopper oxidase-like protein SKU5 n=1 Tax=Hibiscus syriacus TaxID=106335 RepID=A0A6A2XSS7_HIBSY|nr:hypothetical protein F3Y22_tig00111398pilonHSYRG00328 [Hibiscus syriacus]